MLMCPKNASACDALRRMQRANTEMFTTFFVLASIDVWRMDQQATAQGLHHQVVCCGQHPCATCLN
jgi:hypothetical protein